MLAACLAGTAAVAQPQTPISTNGAGGTLTRSNGTTTSTNGAGGTAIRTPGAAVNSGRSWPVAHGTAPAHSAAGSSEGNSSHRAIDCPGNVVTVSGNHNVLLRGACAQLSISGTNNVVHWAGPAPQVSDAGNRNVTGPAK